MTIRALLITLLLVPGGVRAAQGESALGNMTYLTQLAGGLLAVIGAILVLAWVLRRLPGATGVLPDAIEILAVRAVGSRDRLLLVQVGQEQLLIAAGPMGLRTLHRLRDPIKLDERPPQVAEGKADFARLLRHIDRRAAKSRSPGPDVSTTPP